MRKFFSFSILLALSVQTAFGGLEIVRSNGITLTGADGINYVGVSGITLTGADGLLTRQSNGITLTGADGITLTGADGITLTGADGSTYTGPNGITLTGADGITLTGADGITLTGADGITLTGADGTTYTADTFIFRRPDGITLTGADGITLTGTDGITLTGADGEPRVGTNGITLTGADGITLTGADGITLTGADGITLTGADGVTGITSTGAVFDVTHPTGITLTGADGITLTGADGITLTGADGITLTGADGITLTGADDSTGLQSVDPELALKLNEATDDTNINAVIVFHRGVNDGDVAQLQQIGILGGTRFRALPAVYATATKQQLIAVSRLPQVRSLYGNRTLTFNSDPYFNITGLPRAVADADLRADNNGLPYSGRDVTVAVLDTGLNATHPDLVGRVVQNVRLADAQSAPAGFVYPASAENQSNTDLASGHGTHVGGISGGSGTASNGRFAGVANNARLLGLSAGDANLMFVLSGLDYLLDRGAAYGVRVVNCSFSAATVYDPNDPVNVATKLLTDRNVNVVFSAGNSGSGNGTLNPYAAAPWVVSVGATDERGALANYSSRGRFGDALQHPTLTAPGTNIVGPRSLVGSTGVSGLGGSDSSRLSASELPYYTTATGTSFSAPQVAGAIALMLEANPNLTPAAIKDILGRTATPLPKYFYHEAGAGMLNTHAAVLEAAFPERSLGLFRSTLSRNSVSFRTSSPFQYEQLVTPGSTASTQFPIPENTVQATMSLSWGLSANDLALKLFGSSNSLVGQSNYLNVAGLTGLREKVMVRNPAPGTYRSSVSHTANIGTSQRVYGALEITQIEYPSLLDIAGLSGQSLADAQASLATNLMLPEGRKFRPDSSVTRGDFAESLVRSGLVPQYSAASPMFTDVRDRYSRGPVESIQANPTGRLIYDAETGGRFNPHNSLSKVAAAIAFVRAANLENATSTAVLPLTVTDTSQVPAQWRGHVAVALQYGYLTLDGTKFNPSRGLKRIELAGALVKIALH
ncbi:MAG: S8 family serine peptidase [Pyrinomonadaceae bacterium]